MEIKDILRQKRIEQNLTMKDVALAVGVSEATISRWESGNIANMKRDKIYSLAKTLHISPAVIMGLDPQPVDFNRFDEYTDLIEQMDDSQKEHLLEYMRFLVSKK